MPSLLADVRVEVEETEVDLSACCPTKRARPSNRKASEDGAKSAAPRRTATCRRTEADAAPKFETRATITYPAPLFPLVVLFGLNAVDELDRVAFGVLTPEIRDWFGLSLTALGSSPSRLAPVSLLLELPIAYFADRRNRVQHGDHRRQRSGRLQRPDGYSRGTSPS